MAQFFRSFRRVEFLSVSYKAEVLLLPDVAVNLPALKSLFLYLHSSLWDSPFQPSNFRTLELYPALNNLGLDYRDYFEEDLLRKETFFRRKEDLADEIPSFFTRLSSLSLTGPLADSDCVLRILRSLTANTAHLSLTSNSRPANFTRLLSALTTPTAIRFLFLSADLTQEKQDLSNALTGLIGLEHLSFHGNISLLSPDFWSFLLTPSRPSSLRWIRLEHFIWPMWHRPSDAELLRLLAGRQAATVSEPELINLVVGQWSSPNECSLAGVVELCRAVRTRGLKVHGAEQLTEQIDRRVARVRERMEEMEKQQVKEEDE
ncbi:hypothetical protein JCM8547_007508 [Rhodosporidiobolus lusitaniae]